VGEAELARLGFDDCQFHDCSFAGSTIRDRTFTRCRFVHSSFADATLEGCKFAAAEEGSGSTWSFCDFAEARFAARNLSLCRFEKGCSTKRNSRSARRYD
jgi:fluoroquinolone resistance protein